MNEITITLAEYNRLLSATVTLELVKKLVDNTAIYDTDDCKRTVEVLGRVLEVEA